MISLRRLTKVICITIWLGLVAFKAAALLSSHFPNSLLVVHFQDLFIPTPSSSNGTYVTSNIKFPPILDISEDIVTISIVILPLILLILWYFIPINLKGNEVKDFSTPVCDTSISYPRIPTIDYVGRDLVLNYQSSVNTPPCSPDIQQPFSGILSRSPTRRNNYTNEFKERLKNIFFTEGFQAYKTEALAADVPYRTLSDWKNRWINDINE